MAAVEEILGLVPRATLRDRLGPVLAVQPVHWAANNFFRAHFGLRLFQTADDAANTLVSGALAVESDRSSAKAAGPSAAAAADAVCCGIGALAVGERACVPAAASPSGGFALLVSLDDDLVRHVLSLVSWRSLARLRATSLRLRALCDSSDDLWRCAARTLWPTARVTGPRPLNRLYPYVWRVHLAAELNRHRQR